MASAGATHRQSVVTAEGPADDADAPNAHNRDDIDVQVWLPPTQRKYATIVSKVVDERPTEGTTTSTKPNKNFPLTNQPIVELVGGKRCAIKFGNLGGVGGSKAFPGSVAKRSVQRGNDESDVDEWMVRMSGKRVRSQVANVARSPPNKNAALTRGRGKGLDSQVRPESVEISPIRLPMSPEERNSPDVDAVRGIWVDLKQDIFNAGANKGNIHDSFIYLTVPKGKSSRDMMGEVAQHWLEVSKAKVKDIAVLYGLCCVKRWLRHKSGIIIDARWVTTWKMIEGSVGVKCRLAVRGFKDKFQDLGTYAGTICR